MPRNTNYEKHVTWVLSGLSGKDVWLNWIGLRDGGRVTPNAALQPGESGASRVRLISHFKLAFYT